MQSNVTVLVNSTDSYADAWAPFFQLFATYWPDCPYPIVLNTEKKVFTWPGVPITASQVEREWMLSRPPTWSECLQRCLERIETPLILYLQEDYFLNARVETAQLEEFAAYLLTHGYAHIGLTHFGSHGPFHQTAHPLLWEVDRRAAYRISLQAGLWNVQALARQLRPHENPWQLESYGSRRAGRGTDRYLAVNRHVFNDRARRIFPYQPTGIVGGAWCREVVVDLFRTHGIEVDFTQRGFCDRETQIRTRRPLTPSRIYGRVKSMF